MTIEELVAEIENVVPESAGRIGFDGPPLPFPQALDSSEFGSVVGTVGVTPFGQGVAETVGHFRRPGTAPHGGQPELSSNASGRNTAAASETSKGYPWQL